MLFKPVLGEKLCRVLLGYFGENVSVSSCFLFLSEKIIPARARFLCGLYLTNPGEGGVKEEIYLKYYFTVKN